MRLLRLMCVALAAPGFVAVAADDIHRESIEWCDVWMPNMNQGDLPRVLLIGDSITRAYYKDVETALSGKAYVARLTTSKALGDPALLAEVTTFASEAKFDVLHFNVGLHGWAYTEEQYGQHLPDLLAAIRKAAPGARLIWASTTPLRKDQASGASNVRIRARNALARQFFSREHIPIDDLFTLMEGRDELHTDDFHYKPEGSALLARQVAEEVTKVLLGVSGK